MGGLAQVSTLAANPALDSDTMAELLPQKNLQSCLAPGVTPGESTCGKQAKG